MAEKATVFSVRMDSSVKKELDEFCDAVGMNTNTAINIFARAVLRKRHLPFEVEDDLFYSESNIKHLLKVKEDDLAGRNMSFHELRDDADE